MWPGVYEVDRSGHVLGGGPKYDSWRSVPVLAWTRTGTLLCLLLGLGIWIQQELVHPQNPLNSPRQQLAALPQAELLKPALLGYHHLVADFLWLQSLQVLGARDVRLEEYKWLFDAFDTITTLDPQFVAAYDAGAVVLTELARRVDLSNRLLEKGLMANPTAWRIPFLLGFNHFYAQRDYRAAAGYLAIAARLPGRPNYVPELASRLYVEADSPELAMKFLDSMLAETKDPLVVTALERRRAEVVIEIDIAMLEAAVAQYRRRYDRHPATLAQLLDERILVSLPPEPFGGTYQLDSRNGHVTSTTHPERMKLFRPEESESGHLDTDEP